MDHPSLYPAAVAVAVLLVSAGTLRSAKPDANTEQFRKEVIDKFQRTGLSTTPGDAMMLRMETEGREEDAHHAASSRRIASFMTFSDRGARWEAVGS